MNVPTAEYRAQPPAWVTLEDGRKVFGRLEGVPGSGKAQFVEYEDPDLAAWKSATSLTLDVLPVVGSGKAMTQLYTGKDVLTGEPTSRWIEAGGLALGMVPFGRVLGKGATAVESGVWKLNPFQRGQQIEQALGHNLPGNFPVIDRFENGLATSIKSIDLDAATYQSGSTLTRTLNGYVDKVAGFQGRTWAGVRIRGQDITGRALDLAIPHSGSAAQEAIISQTVKYGVSRSVTVKVIPFR